MASKLQRRNKEFKTLSDELRLNGHLNPDNEAHYIHYLLTKQINSMENNRKTSELLELLLENFKSDNFNCLCNCVGNLYCVKKCITSDELNKLYLMIDEWALSLKFTILNYILFETNTTDINYFYRPYRKRPRIALLKEKIKYYKSIND